MSPDAATRRQIEAADPAVSAWLSANAGSGKTRVLTDRVARLLLRGVPPQNILCLTYTRAAAAEMQNRLFARLGDWAMLPDEALREQLATLGEEGCAAGPGLDFARTLFARAIETPGGLRIQTIHSFCAALLRRFPLESGISPLFRTLEEPDTKQLHEEVLDALAGGPEAALLADVARLFSGADIGKLAAEVASAAAGFSPPADARRIWRLLGLSEKLDEGGLLARVFTGEEASLVAALRPILEASGRDNDHKLAEKLAAIDLSAPRLSDLEALLEFFLYKETATISPGAAKTDRMPTKALREAHPEIVARLHDFMRRVEAAQEPFRALLTARRTLALHRFAGAFLAGLEARKQARGVLDFDDLIARATALLSDPAVAQWVLYKLDGGLDHILVDEAQDTSPGQWKVISLLAREFAAGEGARPETERTIFVVGDFKQSIYSFQGADPGEFARMREDFAARLEGAGKTLRRGILEHSFRSAPAILRFVDAVFRENPAQGIGGPPSHVAYHAEMPGRVDLWPLEEAPEQPDDSPWYMPVDRPAANDPQVILADRLARWIRQQCETGVLPERDGTSRPIWPGDFLILVQKRSELFHEIIRACKAHGLPIAGADRLRLDAELAVKDLLALLSFLDTPEDDLSLAAALRSPLCGLDESALFDLAHGRGERRLWAVLLERRERFPGTVGMLEDLRAVVDYLSPYELLERILVRHDGRARLLARLGPEAEEGVDALLERALAHERREPPSLTGFLAWQGGSDTEIRRRTDTAAGSIRVMTTHGAKGLEAPIVILPDTNDRQPDEGGEILRSDDGTALWRPAKAQLLPAPLRDLAATARQARQDEHDRLLYVAMTRAERWLVLCGAKKKKARSAEDSWYRKLERAMRALDTEPLDTPTGAGLRHRQGEWPPAAQRDSGPKAEGKGPPEGAGGTALPGWALSPAARPDPRPEPLSPSSVAGAKALPGSPDALEEDAAMLRGTRIHLLLQHLPRFAPAERESIARQLLRGNGQEPSPAEFRDVLDEALRVLEDPDLAWIFREESFSEVGISAALPALSGQRIRGTIDRLVLSEGRVSIVDFKTNRTVPDRPEEVPAGILRQMALYLEAVEALYPDHVVELSILWSSLPALMRLPQDIVRNALRAPPAPGTDPPA